MDVFRRILSGGGLLMALGFATAAPALAEEAGASFTYQSNNNGNLLLNVKNLNPSGGNDIVDFDFTINGGTTLNSPPPSGCTGDATSGNCIKTITPQQARLQILGLSSGGQPTGIDVEAHFAGGGTDTTTAQTCPDYAVMPTGNLPPGRVNEPYQQQFTATGGTAPHTWGLNGSLPSGMSLGLNNGLLSGTPQTQGGFGGQIVASDAAACVEIGGFFLDILAAAQPAATGIDTVLIDGLESGKNATAYEGEVVLDGATISGDNAQTATGTVTFFVYRGEACGDANQLAQDVRVVSNARAVGELNLPVGTYVIKAVYSGDANNAPATGACDEHLTVTEKPSAGSSPPRDCDEDEAASGKDEDKDGAKGGDIAPAVASSGVDVTIVLSCDSKKLDRDDEIEVELSKGDDTALADGKVRDKRVVEFKVPNQPVAKAGPQRKLKLGKWKINLFKKKKGKHQLPFSGKIQIVQQPSPPAPPPPNPTCAGGQPPSTFLIFPNTVAPGGATGLLLSCTLKPAQGFTGGYAPVRVDLYDEQSFRNLQLVKGQLQPVGTFPVRAPIVLNVGTGSAILAGPLALNIQLPASIAPGKYIPVIRNAGGFDVPSANILNVG